MPLMPARNTKDKPMEHDVEEHANLLLSKGKMGLRHHDSYLEYWTKSVSDDTLSKLCFKSRSWDIVRELLILAKQTLDKTAEQSKQRESL